MNDINFSSQRSPDPINSVPKSEPQLPVKPVYKKENNLDPVFKISLIILSIFLIILSFSTIYNLISKTQGQGEVITNEQGGVITVNTSATVYATPDIAKINIGVETSEASIQKAADENSRKINNIINYAQGEGVPLEDIKVIEYIVEPQYQKQSKSAEYPEGKIIIPSYKVKEVIEIKMAKDKVQGVVESAINAGANTIGELVFDVKDKANYIEEAKAEAIEKARNEAQKIAQNLNVGLGNPLNYSDNLYGDYRISKSLSNFEEGKNEITVNVYITYSIK
ncbi:MAG TPA: SIMPL domain-containing protein [Candidatus Pacearchaeota archaeon]|nr:SIMPL domain-containing protein [Candidatus Pacearchaeota archaeon]